MLFDPGCDQTVWQTAEARPSLGNLVHWWDEEENEKAMPQESSLQQEDGVPQGPRGSHLWEKAVNPGGVAVQEDAQQQQLASQLQEEAVQVDAVEQQGWDLVHGIGHSC